MFQFPGFASSSYVFTAGYPSYDGWVSPFGHVRIKAWLPAPLTFSQAPTSFPPAVWFSHFAYADENGAIAWTINKGCEDTYVITLTSTDPKLVHEDDWLDRRVVFNNGTERIFVDAAIPEVDGPPPAYTVEVVKFKTHDLLPGYNTNKEVEVRITHPELYDSLKAFMVNKPRNARTLQDLTAKAHREAGNNTLIGNNNRIKISAENLTKHIFAAWMSGVGAEAEMFAAALQHGQSASAVNRNLSGKTMVLTPGNAAKQFAGYALRATAILRSNQPVHAVLTQIDELL